MRVTYKADITKSVNNFIKDEDAVQSYANDSCSLFFREENELIEIKEGYPVSRGNVTAYVEFMLYDKLICASSKGNIVKINGSETVLNENIHEMISIYKEGVYAFVLCLCYGSMTCYMLPVEYSNTRYQFQILSTYYSVTETSFYNFGEDSCITVNINKENLIPNIRYIFNFSNPYLEVIELTTVNNSTYSLLYDSNTNSSVICKLVHNQNDVMYSWNVLYTSTNRIKHIYVYNDKCIKMGFIDEKNRLFIANNILESIYFTFVTGNAIRLSTNNGNIRCVGTDGGIYDIINSDNSYDYEVIKTKLLLSNIQNLQPGIAECITLNICIADNYENPYNGDIFLKSDSISTFDYNSKYVQLNSEEWTSIKCEMGQCTMKLQVDEPTGPIITLRVDDENDDTIIDLSQIAYNQLVNASDESLLMKDSNNEPLLGDEINNKEKLSVIKSFMKNIQNRNRSAESHVYVFNDDECHEVYGEEAAERIMSIRTRSWSSFWKKIKSVVKAVIQAVAKITEIIIQGISATVKYVVDGVTYVLEFIVDKINEAVHAVVTLFHQIGIGIKNLFKWLSFIFNPEDIMASAVGIKNCINLALQSVEETVSNIDAICEFSDSAFDSIISNIEKLKSSITNNTQESPKLEASSNNYASDALLPSLQKAEENNMLNKSKSTFESIFDSEEFINIFKGIGLDIVDNIKEEIHKVANLKGNICNNFLCVFIDIIEIVIKTCKQAVNLSLRFIAKIIKVVIDEARRLLNMEVPLVSQILHLFGISSFTYLDCICVICAVPLNVIYKIKYKVAPFKRISSKESADKIMTIISLTVEIMSCFLTALCVEYNKIIALFDFIWIVTSFYSFRSEIGQIILNMIAVLAWCTSVHYIRHPDEEGKSDSYDDPVKTIWTFSCYVLFPIDSVAVLWSTHTSDTVNNVNATLCCVRGFPVLGKSPICVRGINAICTAYAIVVAALI